MLYHTMGDSLFLSSVCIYSCIFRLHLYLDQSIDKEIWKFGVGETVNRHVAVTPID